MAEGTCQLDGCERPRFNRGWCAAHWNRVRRNGEPGSAEVKPRRVGCQVEGCERKHAAHGYCAMHRYRWVKYGDPLVKKPRTPSGEENTGWKGSDVRYGAVHQRIRRARGSATLCDCEGCGNPAAEWAYKNNGSPTQRFDPDVYAKGMHYSTNLDDYVPMCRGCHRRFDRSGLPLDAWLDEWNAARVRA